MLYIGITSCAFPPWTELSKKNHYDYDYDYDLILVSSEAVIRVVTQRFSEATQYFSEALRDDPNNGCVGDYFNPGSDNLVLHQDNILQLIIIFLHITSTLDNVSISLRRIYIPSVLPYHPVPVRLCRLLEVRQAKMQTGHHVRICFFGPDIFIVRDFQIY